MPVVAPTVRIQELAYANLASGASRAFASETVAVGDRLAIIARSADGDHVFTTASQTAGTATLTAWARTQNTGTAGTNCRHAVFTADVLVAGTMTVSVATTASTTHPCSMDLHIATGALATNTFLAAAARQLSITPASVASYIATSAADWGAGASNGATFIPVGQGQVIDQRSTDGVDQQASIGNQFSAYCAHWSDTAGAGATTYGLNAPSAGTYNTVAVEFTGSVSGPPTPVLMESGIGFILNESGEPLLMQ